MSGSHDEAAVVLRKRDLRGSRLRFLMLTSGHREQVASALTGLVARWGIVDPAHDRWMPEDFLNPKEAKLGESGQLLPPRVRSQLTEWWLKVPKNANTPNWDLASTCTIDGSRGIILVEGKAHRAELKEDGKAPGNGQNDEQIERAIEEANQGLNGITPGWNLSRGSHYQLSNRFAWAWKIASLGVPTILV